MALQAMAEEGRGQVGLGVELDGAEDLPRRLRDARQPVRARPAIHHRAAALDGHAHVLEDREVGEDRGDLIRLGDAPLGARELGLGGDVAAVEGHAAGGRRQLARDELEERALARAIGADHGSKLAGVHLEVDGIDGEEPSEAPRELLGAQQDGRCQRVAPR